LTQGVKKVLAVYRCHIWRDKRERACGKEGYLRIMVWERGVRIGLEGKGEKGIRNSIPRVGEKSEGIRRRKMGGRSPD